MYGYLVQKGHETKGIFMGSGVVEAIGGLPFLAIIFVGGLVVALIWDVISNTSKKNK